MANNDTAAIERIRSVVEAANRVFIDREDLVEVVALGLVCGEHVAVLGPPGTGKSACIRFFAGAMGLSFFRRVLNPDLPREDLVGPIDPLALKEGRWERAWTGLATCAIAFLDEIGKASSQVQNLFLDCMEERRVTSGNIDRPIPLHLVLAASNETFDVDSPAIWDRFTLRLVVRYLNETGDFVRLLEKAWGALDPPCIPVRLDELQGLRAECLRMAAVAHADQRVQITMVKLWKGLSNVASSPTSDRRWLRLLIVAAAHALLDGRAAIEPSDLIVGKHLLWHDIDEIDAIEAFIVEVLDEEGRELRVATARVDEMEQMVEAMVSSSGGDTLEKAARLKHRAKQLYEEINARCQGNVSNNGKWGALMVRVSLVISNIDDKA